MRLPRPQGWKQWAASVAGAVVIFSTLFVFIAPYNIAASVPHLPGVSWLLHTYMANAVKTWSMGAEPPDWLDIEDPALVRLGAGHFETGCAPCHGAPGRDGNPVTQHMLPAPPKLDEAPEKYDRAEFYWLVWNGLKYTAMPAWSGGHRQDEAWAVAAFMSRYDEFDDAAYRELAWGPVEPEGGVPAGAHSAAFGSATGRMDRLMEECARCHGKDGLGRDGTAPKLAGQSQPFLRETLLAYAQDRRQSGIMEPLAAPLAPEEIEALARRYAEMEPFGRARPAPDDPALYALGQKLAGTGTDEIPSCLSCHGEGMTPPRKPIYPRISGQHRRWLVTWLHLWREREIGGTAFTDQMHAAARSLTDRQIDALAEYFAVGGGNGDLAER